MPVVGDIIRCVRGGRIGERLLVKEVNHGMYKCEVIDAGLFHTNNSIGDLVEVADCDIIEFCIIEER